MSDEQLIEELARMLAHARHPGVDMGGKHNPLPTEYQKARMFIEDHHSDFLDEVFEERLQARISSLERELEEATKRADHWQHQFHVMGATANKAERERDEARQGVELLKDEVQMLRQAATEIERERDEARAERDRLDVAATEIEADRDLYEAQLDQARALLQAWLNLHGGGRSNLTPRTESFLAESLSTQQKEEVDLGGTLRYYGLTQQKDNQ